MQMRVTPISRAEDTNNTLKSTHLIPQVLVGPLGPLSFV